MSGQRFRVMTLTLGVVGLLLVLSVTNSDAVPSFARQTGLDCNACHTMFPELTSVAATSKINGFTASKKCQKALRVAPTGHRHTTNSRLPTSLKTGRATTV